MNIETLLHNLLTNGLPEQTFLDLAAIFAASEPTQDQIMSVVEHDKLCNPHNDSYKPPRRGFNEIRADLRYKFAHEMLKARGRTLEQLENRPGSGRR